MPDKAIAKLVVPDAVGRQKRTTKDQPPSPAKKTTPPSKPAAKKKPTSKKTIQSKPWKPAPKQMSVMELMQEATKHDQAPVCPDTIADSAPLPAADQTPVFDHVPPWEDASQEPAIVPVPPPVIPAAPSVSVSSAKKSMSMEAFRQSMAVAPTVKPVLPDFFRKTNDKR